MQADVGSLFKDIEDFNVRISSLETWKKSFCTNFIIFMVVLALFQWPISLLYFYFFML